MSPELRQLSQQLDQHGRASDERAQHELLVQLCALDPGEIHWPLRLIRLYAQARDWERAIATTRAGLALQPGLPHLRMELANLLSRDGRLDEVPAAVAEALAVAPPEVQYRLEAIRLLADAGDFA